MGECYSIERRAKRCGVKVLEVRHRNTNLWKLVIRLTIESAYFRFAQRTQLFMLNLARKHRPNSLMQFIIITTLVVRASNSCDITHVTCCWFLSSSLFFKSLIIRTKSVSSYVTYLHFFHFIKYSWSWPCQFFVVNNNNALHWKNAMIFHLKVFMKE